MHASVLDKNGVDKRTLKPTYHTEYNPEGLRDLLRAGLREARTVNLSEEHGSPPAYWLEIGGYLTGHSFEYQLNATINDPSQRNQRTIYTRRTDRTLQPGTICP